MANYKTYQHLNVPLSEGNMIFIIWSTIIKVLFMSAISIHVVFLSQISSQWLIYKDYFHEYDLSHILPITQLSLLHQFRNLKICEDKYPQVDINVSSNEVLIKISMVNIGIPFLIRLLLLEDRGTWMWRVIGSLQKGWPFS